MIVGISGKQYSGKTTLAKYISRRSKNRVAIFSFAGKLKQVAAMILGVDPKLLSDHDFKKSYLENWSMTGREFMQWFGTDVCRARNENVWVDLTMQDIGDSDAVIDDVRFPNEAMAIRSAGGVLIRLDGDPSGARGDLNDLHDSETALDDFVFDIRLNTSEMDVNEVGREVYSFLKTQFGRKFSLIGDRQIETKILRNNFSPIFGEQIDKYVKTPEDLNKRVIDLMADILIGLDVRKSPKKEEFIVKPRTNSAKDITPEVSSGKISSLIIDIEDGSKSYSAG